VFVGKHDRQLDEKGRVAIPAEFVKQIGGTEGERKLVVTPGSGGFISLITMKHWEEKYEEMAKQFVSAIPHEFYQFCQERDVDKAGRILIDDKARQLAGLPDPAGDEPVQVVVAGGGRYMQIWRKDVYESRASSPAAFAQAVRL
jgi:DNA-binding transcriptional regulator/RsmH inhibitor MraZ